LSILPAACGDDEREATDGAGDALADGKGAATGGHVNYFRGAGAEVAAAGGEGADRTRPHARGAEDGGGRTARDPGGEDAGCEGEQDEGGDREDEKRRREARLAPLPKADPADNAFAWRLRYEAPRRADKNLAVGELEEYSAQEAPSYSWVAIRPTRATITPPPICSIMR
jgi:hypothetical protein